MTSPQIILLHGLHMHAWAMKPLANRLKQQGFQAHCFDYASVFSPLPQHLQALQQFAQQLQHHQPQAPIYWVGHSLGGLIIRHFLAQYPQYAATRVVTLGTPHQGSHIAQRLAQSPLSRALLGHAYAQNLDGNAPPLSPHTQLGSIAGSAPYGLGRIMQLEQPNDGTVSLAETQCSGATDHIILPLSHTALILSQQASKQSAHFLRYAHFSHATS